VNASFAPGSGAAGSALRATSRTIPFTAASIRCANVSTCRVEAAKLCGGGQCGADVAEYALLVEFPEALPARMIGALRAQAAAAGHKILHLCPIKTAQFGYSTTGGFGAL
jgi:hypothetical protein